MKNKTTNIVEIRNLSVSVEENDHRQNLLNGVDLDVPAGAIMGLVGGSGSGKTTTGLSILRLIDPALTIDSGEIRFQGKDVMRFTDIELRDMRGGNVSMVFQEPLLAFNPVFTIGYQIAEMLRQHTRLPPHQFHEKICSLLIQAGIKEPERVSKCYPHQLSGGMRQRSMIAMAIAAKPSLIIADEPTSNLDVTLQAKIMELFRTLNKDFNITILLITHDLGVVSHLTDYVAVMSQGQVVEQGLTRDVLENPEHAYTQKLLKVIH
ncbi:MAG: ABC transporter ATP-binding protein [Candidatus Omnitrophica bacterium]|nr:ABC transporter ATP-binding protein [Candidatus Omnitrophota bacterium]